MIFLLTGEVQIGKTRWLEQVCAELMAAKVPVMGVLAPGVWRRNGETSATPSALSVANTHMTAQGQLEKLGIENVLLPEGERIEFAWRRDVAYEKGMLESARQAVANLLAWVIFDEAINRVNEHFVYVRTCIAQEEAADPAPGLVVIDELGRLELECGGGLTEAVKLLDEGQTPRFPHALVVVRARLLEQAKQRFSEAWGGAVVLSPGDEARLRLLKACQLASTNENRYH